MLTVDDKIVISLRRISQAIDCWSRKMLGKHGLTSPQLAVLREIMGGQNTSMSSLAAVLHLSQPTVSGILTRLAQRGLVECERSGNDRRVVLTAVTDAGRELAAKAPPLLRDGFCQELRQLPRHEQEQILNTLARVAEMMQAPEVENEPYFSYES